MCVEMIQRCLLQRIFEIGFAESVVGAKKCTGSREVYVALCFLGWEGALGRH